MHAGAMSDAPTPDVPSHAPEQDGTHAPPAAPVPRAGARRARAAKGKLPKSAPAKPLADQKGALASPSPLPKRLNLSIELSVAHCLTFMEDLAIRGDRFDVVDTSNLADHCGLLNLLLHGSVVLRQPIESELPDRAQLRTTSFLAFCGNKVGLHSLIDSWKLKVTRVPPSHP